MTTKINWDEVQEAMERIGAMRSRKGDVALCRSALRVDRRRLAIIQSDIIQRHETVNSMKWSR